MRIIAGELKSRAVKAPEGAGTRPTSDRVRESIFNILASLLSRQDMPFGSFALALDLFAGSGALAFEALSRGVPRAVLVEADREAQETIRTNARSLGVTGRVDLERYRTAHYLKRLQEAGQAKQPEPGAAPWLIFADPPYAETDYDALLALLDSPVSIPPGSIAVIEHSARNGPDPDRRWTRLEPVSEHAWGDTRVRVYRYRADGEGKHP
ncbi:MAG: RsmD family RNA methyltransferase [Deltaproteobacteria bacterium]|nr:RsmD family RNA methyltransferase [Deltaproteobacteria bacterium]